MKAASPTDRLLVFSPKEGWESRCTFPDKPLPDGPFPHFNNAADFHERIRILKWTQYLPCAAGALIVAAVIAAFALFQ